MRFDTALKQSFAIVVAFLVGAAAYFQASGIASLVASSLLPETVPARVLRALAFSPPATSDHIVTAAAILERNPFDSLTGPLSGGDGLPANDRARAHNPADDDKPCTGARVLLISASDEPDWSFAAIASDGQKTVLRRVGDEVAGYSVGAIERSRVWLVSKESRCRADLGAPPTKPPPPPPKPATGSGGLPSDIAAGIRQVSANEYTVERSTLESILGRQAELLGKVRAWPEKDGIRLGGVKPDSLLGAIGLTTGDKLQRINGFDLSDPKAGLEAYTKLTTASHVTITVLRAGKPMNVDLAIR